MSATSSGAGTAPEVSVGQGVYERKSTGLVRSISLRSGVYFNVITIGVMWSVLAITQIATGFAQANPLVTAILAVAFSLFPVLLYGIWTSTIPRAGGDYVWNGRTFHPWVGLAANFNATVWYTLGNGFLAFLLAQFAFPTFFGTLARIFDSGTFANWSVDIAGDGWTFGIGVAGLVAAMLITQFMSMRQAMRVVFGLFAITMLGLLVSILVLLFSSRGDFTGIVTEAGASYGGVIAAAEREGFAVDADFSLWASILAIPPLYLALAYTVGAAYTGGELRRPHVTGFVSPLAAMLMVGILVVIAFALVGSVIGFDFLGAATFLSNAGSEAYPFAEPAGYFAYVNLLTDWDVVLAIIAVAFVAAPMSTIVATVLFATRNLFAWSFDRMLPSRVSDVNPRTGTPIVAPVIVTLVSIIYLAFLVWGSPTFAEALGAIILGTTLSFIITALAGIVFPYVRPDLYEAAGFRRTIGRFPALSVVAALALVVYGIMFYSLLSQDALGSNTTNAIGAMIIVVGIAAVLYPIAYCINRTRGVDVSLVGRELPPE
jgi:APA family basic amino acid/polyamine antiporter